MNKLITLLLALSLVLTNKDLDAQNRFESLSRGIIGVDIDAKNVLVSWRLLITDNPNVRFNVYRKIGNKSPKKITPTPISETNLVDKDLVLAEDISWFVTAVVNGRESKKEEGYSRKGDKQTKPYLTINLKTPQGYSPNDGSVGDLDGDGNYELVVHMTGRGHDNSHAGETDPPILQAYKLDGTLLWEIDLGKNIREGAHYTQFLVYDFDGDGKAEVVCKTADGTTDAAGVVIGNGNADFRNSKGYVLSGPEYLTIFNGLTGKAINTTEYLPPRHPTSLTPTTEELKELWGDGYGNRLDRFLAGVAFLDGKRPSIIMSRGYYTRSVISAWNFDNGKLVPVWTFDSHEAGKESYSGQGNHNLSVADVDGDGKDEIIFGACVIDDDGTGLYSTGLGHGDALHVTDLIPDRPGLEVFDIQERFDDAGAHMRDARTGEILWKKASIKAGDDGEGPGRGNAFDIDPRYPGAECWVRGAGITALFSAKGEIISPVAPPTCNFASWWDGDLLRELLDKNFVAKWNWKTQTVDTLLYAPECRSNNGTKATPILSADILGDWREEVIWRTEDNQTLHIYSTPIPTKHRFITLMQDPVYRLGVAWQNVAYNQPPHVSFYLGERKEE